MKHLTKLNPRSFLEPTMEMTCETSLCCQITTKHPLLNIFAELQKDKTGLFTGSYATNPLTGKPIPVWVADYVLATYGTGAIMAVPAHDTRDYEFAVKFDLPVVEVVDGRGEADLPYTGDGPLINSSVDGLDLNGMGVTEAKAKCINFLEEKGVGQVENYLSLSLSLSLFPSLSISLHSLSVSTHI